jgi:ankyrin repeat protein
LILTVEASEKNILEIVKILIENGAELEAKNEDGWTPLHFGKV